MFSGKPRTKLGKWLDRRGITQEWLVSKTKLNRSTMSQLASNEKYSPSMTTVKKIMKVIREVDPGAKVDDFFDI